MTSYISKYITILILGLTFLMLNGANALARVERISRLPMQKQLSMKTITYNCITNVRKYKKGRSKITVDQRKVLCLINYAKLGQSNAQYILGKMYAHIHKQFVALKWLKQAFEAKDKDGIYVGNPDAGFEVGKMYLDAYLFNHKKSALENSYMWLTHSAMKGSKLAKVGLTRLYFKYQHYDDAYVWYRISQLDHRKIEHELNKQEVKDLQFSLSDARKEQAKKNIDEIITRMPIRVIR